MMFNRKKRGQKMLASLLSLTLFIGSINFPYIQVQADELMTEQETTAADDDLKLDVSEDDLEEILLEDNNAEDDQDVQKEESHKKDDKVEEKESLVDIKEEVQEEKSHTEKSEEIQEESKLEEETEAKEEESENLVTIKVSGNDITSGSYKNITWVIDANGKLTVEGTGDFSDSTDSDRAPWSEYCDSIKSAEIDVKGMTNASYMFSGCEKLESLDLSNFDTSNVTSMRWMFSGCENLETLDINNFDFSNANDVSGMFSNCTNLQWLILDDIKNTANVTNMFAMFRGCTKLGWINMFNFNTANVTNMGSMFESCSSLNGLDLYNFDTSNVYYMSSMFENCSSLTDLYNFNQFNTEKVETMSNMFKGCSSLVNLDLSSFDTSNVCDMSGMFFGCSSLIGLDLSNFNVESVREDQLWKFNGMREMFEGCSSLRILYTPYNVPSDLTAVAELPVASGDVWCQSDGTEIRELPKNLSYSIEVVKNAMDSEYIARGISGDITWGIDINGKLTVEGIGDFAEQTFYEIPWYNYRVFIKSAEISVTGMTNVSYMFRDCKNLISLNIDKFNTIQVTNMSSMFYGCESLESLDLSSFNTSQVTNMDSMFGNCNSLKSLDLSSFNTSRVTSMEWMFGGCESLESLDLSSFDTSRVTSMGWMFGGCESLESLDLSNFDTSQVTDMDYMFYSCKSLKSLDLSSFDTSQVTDMNSMFGDCNSLKNLDLSSFNTSYVINMMNMFNGCNNLKSLDLSNFDTSQVTDIDTTWGMYSMFRDCNSLESLDLSSFNTSQVTTMESMFENCSSLKNLDISNFNTSQVTNMNYMFENCSNLENLDLSNFYTGKVTSMYFMFADCKSLKSLNLSSFDTSQVTIMHQMFGDCSSLESLDISNFNTSQVIDMRLMFQDCSNLKSLDLSNFNVSQTMDISGMLQGCNSLDIVKTPCNVKGNVYLPKLSGDVWYQSDGTEITILPKNLTYSITITKNKVPATTTPYITATKTKASYECGDILNTNDLIVKYYDADGTVTTITNYTTNASKIDMSTPGKKTLVITYKNMTANVEITVTAKTITDDIASGNYGNIKWVIDKNGKLTVEGTGEIYDSTNKIPWNAYSDSIQSAVINMKNITNIASMFSGCKNLKSIDLSGLDTDHVTNMEGMFFGCSALTSLDLSNLNTANVTNMNNLFFGCSNLITICTPCNVPSDLTAIAELPAASDDVWYQPDGTAITELPKNLSYSIIITKNKTPIITDPYIIAAKTKTTYQCGDTLNIDDITVNYYDTNGTITPITNYTTNADKIDMSTPGKKTLEIEYNGIQTTIELTVTEKGGSTNPEEPENPEKKRLKVSLKYGENYTYTGSAIKPEVVVTYNEAIMTEGIDYTIKYSNNINASATASSKDKKPKVIVTGKGNWNGSDSVNFVIQPADIQNVIIGGSTKDENGEEILTVIEGTKKTKPVLYYGDLKVNSKDYMIIEKAGNGYSSKDNGKIITIKAKTNGNFTGTRTMKVNVVNKSDLKKFSVFLDSTELYYDGTNQKKNIDFNVCDKEDNSIDLKEGTDYVVSWSGNTTNAGKVKFTVIGLGLYSGTNITKTCTIKPIKADESEMIVNGINEAGYDFVSTGVTIDNLSVTYNGVVLEKGKDYKVTYGNNKKAGIAKYTVSFLGNYKGSAAKKGTFIINKAVFGETSGDALNVIIADKSYNGKPGAYKSTPYIILNGIALKTSDYTATYYTDAECTEPVSNTNKIELEEDERAATIYVKIETKDKSSYSGSITTKYQVRNNKGMIDLSNAKVVIGKKSVTYTGEACTNTIKVYCKKGTGWRRIYEDTDFKVTYANNVNKGKATIIITGIDGTNYTGSKTASFNIAAQKVKLK